MKEPIIVGLIAAAAMLLSGTGAQAQASLDKCDAILKDDLFNRVTFSSSASASEKAQYEEHLFSLDASEAFKEYDTAYNSKKSESTSGSGEGHYAVIGGSFDFTHSYDRELSQSDFEKTFNTAKSQRSKDSNSSNSKETSLISKYQSAVRDSGSVKAWENCMARSPEPGLLAYGYRDSGGNPYIVVMWIAGAFAASNPVITVRFNPTEPGMVIDGAQARQQIATGSGVAFPIRAPASAGARSKANGFVVLVNGELRNGNQLVQSFRSEAVIPRDLGPLPCNSILTANRVYEMGTLDASNGVMKWIAEVTTMGEQPSDQPGTTVIEASMSSGDSLRRGTRSRLRLSGSNFTIETAGIVHVSGKCSGEKLTARLVNVRLAQLAPDFVVRAKE